MAVKATLPTEFEEGRRESLLKGILSREGGEAFGRALQVALPQILVSTLDLQPRIAQVKALTAAAYLEELYTETLPKPKYVRPQLETPYVAPGNEVERVIAEIWEDLLGIEQVGIHDNFYDLGGHSLLGTRVLSRLRDVFQVELTIRAVLESPTIAGLAEVLTSALEGNSQHAVRPIEKLDRGDTQELLNQIDQLSGDKVDLLLKDLLASGEIS